MTTQGYIRFPTISGDRIVFTAEDDLWSVSTAGGRAERLTAGVAEATHASFSPDGAARLLGSRRGPVEVYVMPSEGGDARRLTYHGSRAFVVGWTPDGAKILYSTYAGQPFFAAALHEIAPTGGEPVDLALWPAALGRLRAGWDARLRAQHRRSRPLEALSRRNRWLPVDCARWVGRVPPSARPRQQHRLALLGRCAHLLHLRPRGHRQCLLLPAQRRGYPPPYAARRLLCAQPRDRRQRLVYHAGGDLYLLDPAATGSQRLDVILPSAHAHRARKFVQPAHNLDSWAPHPQGHSLALTIRGKAVTLGSLGRRGRSAWRRRRQALSPGDLAGGWQAPRGRSRRWR